MVDLRGHFSNPEALIEALDEMEKVLTESRRVEESQLTKQRSEPTFPP